MAMGGHQRTPTAEQLILALDLQPLPVEGGMFRETYRSSETIASEALPGRYRSEKPFGSAIFYLLTSEPGCCSVLHRLPTDEIYHFYLGDPVELLHLHPDGTGERILLGQDVLNGQQVQHLAPGGTWQGSRLQPGGRFALLGTTMAPGYSPDDFELGERQALLQQYPKHTTLIRLLTRD
jgi:uncharacterized protein